MKTFIIVKNSKHGTHQWKDAPEEVDHLRNLHRHNFLFETKIEVSHDDRELEFFMVRDFIQNELDKLPSNLQTSSCEQLAKSVIKMIHTNYGERDMSCTVSEDGQNAAIVEYSKDHVIPNILFCDEHGTMSIESERHNQCIEVGCILRQVTKS